MKKLSVFLAFVIAAFFVQAQNLTVFSTTLQPNVSKGKCFISFSKQTVFSEMEAAAAKESLDIMYALSVSGRDTIKEFYNLSEKSAKVAERLQGTQTGIVAISFDKDQFAKCKSIADLKRMTGHITNNSFSFYAVVANNHTGEVNYPCFIFQLANGKRGIMFVEKAAGNDLQLTVKME